ncbi:MAG: ABC transporter ATP-binding protein [Deltaproteobacteria bacterium]|nr:ABC transporter ATP-binding protein [Deltaproteobacteria bacterium]
MATAKIEVKGLCKTFGPSEKSREAREVLKDVTFGIRDGEILCLLGPSGCGKTTVLNILAGFQEPSRGEVAVNGRRIERPGPDRGVVFQEHGLFPWRTVLQNILFGPQMLGREPSESLSAAQQYIDLIGLRGFEHHYPHQLSGGMQQRVSIARVLVNRPDILLMDEPFGKLDAQTRAAMQVLLLDVWEKVRATILFITHDIDEAIFLGDRIFVMSCNPGRVVKEIDVRLPRPRDYDIVASLEYLEIKRSILHVLKGMPERCEAAPASEGCAP